MHPLFSRIAVIAAVAWIPTAGMTQELAASSTEIPVPGGAADVGSLEVALDFASILHFSEAARTVIIGNPGVVDGTMSDPHTLVLTGKNVGTTNLVVLGETGQRIAGFVVSVSPSARRTTTVYRGAVQQAYSCIGSCQPLRSLGGDIQTPANGKPAGAAH